MVGIKESAFDADLLAGTAESAFASVEINFGIAAITTYDDAGFTGSHAVITLGATRREVRLVLGPGWAQRGMTPTVAK
ncbi:hypothetical protein HSBAA_21220 [Vreelandella sulfidaeris]|uniref:Uncharacterized protein n=1 Tax=Vreelandella sulfidaeris TaxID=115553 RepID=A0A455U442_9GAMM|nr:hypothetical protein HSBAA_21220 [Halomonas sulfidaeris]